METSPPVHDTPSAYAPPQPPPAPRRRNGWLIAALAFMTLMFLLSCCTLGILLFSREGDGGFGSPAIAVIPIDGQIMGTSAGGLLGDAGITPEEVLSKLRQADDDESVKAVLLRIDSPGGTAAASQEIAMEVARMDKPVVASIGDVGASGAYMVASQCDRIVAGPSAAVGSIGVILEVPNFEGLMDKIGVKYRVFTEGEFKDAGSPFRSLTPTETKMIQEDIRVAYDQFVDVVAEGRHMKRSKVEKLATGWVWPGTTAKKLGLVDEIGNYTDGIQAAAKAGHIDGEPRIVTYEVDSLAEALRSLTSSMGSMSPVERALRETAPIPR